MDPSLLNAFGPWGALAAVLIYLFTRKPSPPTPSPVAPDPVKPEPDKPDTPMLDMLKEILKLLLISKGDVIPMSGGAKPQVIESAGGPHLLIPLEGGGYQLDPLPHNPPDVRY